jgi:hypothetical protein
MMKSDAIGLRGVMRRWLLGLGCSMAMTGIMSAPQAGAESLSSQIDTLFGPYGIVLEVTPTNPTFNHTAHFTSSTLATMGLLVSQLAPNAADFPAISTVPGFTYRYNPELEEFERTSTSLGPIFVERARTMGKGRFDVGAAYSYVKFDKLNGEDLGSLDLVLSHGESPVFGEETATVVFEKFDLQSHVLSLFATYGITDHWDVNVLLPIVSTSLDVRAHATLDNVTESIDTPGGTIFGPFHFFDQALGSTEMDFTTQDTKSGVGDLLIRTKYHLLRSDHFDLSPGVILRIPTGDVENFHGLGDTTLNIFAAGSSEISRFHLHGSLGFDINLSHTDRSRVRYAAGVTMQLFNRLAITADVIGSSNLTTQEISVEVPIFDNDAFDTDPPTIAGYTTVTDSLRTDIVDIALGFKVNIVGSLVGFANVFVPLNDDGLRAIAVPTVGLEYSF